LPSPNPVTGWAGQEVIWTNDDSQIHTAASGTVGGADAGQNFDSGILSPGATFSFTLDHPEDIPYYCTLHPQMIRSIMILPAGTEVESSDSNVQVSNNMTSPIPSETDTRVKPPILSESEIAMQADFRLHGNQYFAGRGCYLLQSFNLTTGDDSVLCPANDCSLNLEDGQIYPNTSTGGYVIDGRLKIGTESELGVRSTIQPIRIDLDRIETLEKQEQTTVDFVKGDFDIGENIYSSDITYKITNGTITQENRDLKLDLQGELFGSSNEGTGNNDNSNDGPLEELGRMLGLQFIRESL
jgi:hypothetical protein